MASTFSDLKFELIGLGEQDGTWGTTTNLNIGTAIEEAIAGRATATFGSNADLTLTLSNSPATQVARHYILDVTSAVSLTTTRNLIVPTIDKPYIIENNTTGGQSIVVKTAAGTGVTVPNGKKVMVYVNGTNVVDAFNNIPAGTTVTGEGTVVNTTATQTLTNKTLTSPTLNTPTLTAPVLGTPTSGDLSNCTALSLTTGVTGVLPIANGGTGQATTTDAFNTLLPTQTGNAGKALLTDGTNPYWGAELTLTNKTITLSGLLQLDQSTNIVAAATTDLGTATGNAVTVTHAAGALAITSFGGASLQSGTELTITWSVSGGSLSATYNATSLILPSAANLPIADGDVWKIQKISDSQAYWRVVDVTKANGEALVTPSVGRAVAQIQTFQTGAVATGTTIIPLDDTIPQNTEGTQFMTLDITPTNASSTLEIDVSIKLTSPGAGAYHLIAALFKDSDPDALAVANSMFDASGPNNTNMITFKHIMPAGSTSAMTFKVRGGMNAAGTYTFNGAGGVRQFGGAVASRITIKEYLP